MTGIPKAKKRIRLEKELGNGAAGPRINFPFQPVNIGGGVGAVGVRFGICANADVEFTGFGQRFNQFDRIGKTAVGGGKPVLPLGRIAAQGNNVGHTGFGVTIGDFQNFGTGGIDTG